MQNIPVQSPFFGQLCLAVEARFSKNTAAHMQKLVCSSFHFKNSAAPEISWMKLYDTASPKM
jgi:hypothetical protein